jgi:ATP-dependent Zn protease
MRTPGFAGADLANLLNEAAILAGRRGLTAVRNQEIDDAVDRIVAGMEGKPLTDGKAKQLVAYHEVGHAICGTLTPGHDPVQKVRAGCFERGARACTGARWGSGAACWPQLGQSNSVAGLAFTRTAPSAPPPNPIR